MAKSKSAKQRRQAAEAPKTEMGATVGLKVGDHQFRAFNGIDAAFGADERDYPTYASIPEEFRSHHNQFARVFSALFFSGGTLEQHGLTLKAGVDRPSFFTTFRALACSFAPKHEVKEATLAWLLAEHTEPVAKSEAA